MPPEEVKTTIEKETAILPLAEVPPEIVKNSSRLDGFYHLQEAGARIPEILVGQHEIFDRYCINGNKLTEEDRRLIESQAQALIEKCGKIAVRRNSIILGLPDPGTKHSLGITDPEDAVRAVEEIYKEAAEIIEGRRAEIEVGGGNVGEFYENVAIGFILQEFVDPPEIDPTLLEQDKFPEILALPAGFQATVIEIDGLIHIRIIGVFGNNRLSLTGEGDIWEIEVRPDGGVNTRSRIRVKNRMLITTTRAVDLGSQAGQETLPVPSNRRTADSLSLENLTEIYKVLRRLHENTGRKSWRVEGAIGLERELYFLQAEEYEFDENLLESYTVQGQVFGVQEEADFLEALEYLNGLGSDSSEHLLIYIPPAMILENRPIYDVVINGLINNPNKDRVIVLAGTDSSTAHVNRGLMDARFKYVCVGGEVIPQGFPVELRVEGLNFEVEIIKEVREIIPLQVAVKANAKDIGAKTRNIAQMRELGLPTAEGFVLPRELFLDILKANEADSVFGYLRYSGHSGTKALALKLAREIRDKISVIPSELLDKIRESLRICFGDDLPDLIVRSSGVLEDGGRYSFAGKFESITKVNPERVEEAILKVVKSLFSDGVIEYIFARKSEMMGDLAMPVLIQEYMSNGIGVVAFGEYQGNDDQCLITISQNGCGGIVDGEMDSGGVNIVVDKRTGELINARGDGELITSLLEKMDIPAFLAHLRLIEERVIGGPADVELIVDEVTGHHTFFQARPLTDENGKDKQD